MDGESTKSKRAKRGDGDGNYRQRPDGLWEVRFTLPNGKRKSLYGKTRREVQEKHRAVIRDIAQGLNIETRVQTLEQFLRRWLTDVAAPRVRASTLQRYAHDIEHHLIPALGHHKLPLLTPQHVQSLLNEKSKAGLGPRSVNHMRAVLRSALAEAMRWGLIGRNVAALAQPPRVVKQPITPLNPQQARAFIDFTQDDRLGPLFAVAIATGLRQGELLGLRWEDVDLDRGELRVRFAYSRAAGGLTEPKSKTSRRTIPLPREAAAALRTQRTRTLEARLRVGTDWEDHGLVFPSTRGTPLDGPNVTHHLQRLLAAAGLPRQRFHDLRHCCATYLLAQGVPVRTVSDILGHSQISLTLDTYAHVLPQMRREVADAMDRALASGQ